MNFEKEKVNRVDSDQAKKGVVATSIGNAIEWFDFGLYAQLAVILSANFFGNLPQEMQIVSTFAVFAFAFIVRPIGGIFFSHLGDKYGRKIVLSTTILLMAASTLMLGLLPTQEQIGIWAPILLLVVRMIQSFSTGGEYAGAMTYIAETAPDKTRGKLGSGLEIGTLSGSIMAAILAGLMYSLLSDQQMADWGWRIPFILAAPLGIVGIILRSSLDESPAYESTLEEKEELEYSYLDIFKYYWRDVVVCFTGVAFLNVANYMVLSYMPSFLNSTINLGGTMGSILSIVTMLIMIPAVFFFGWYSDKVGNKRTIIFGLAGFSLFSILAFWLMSIPMIPFVLLGLFIIALFMSTFEGVMPSVLPSMFHTKVRLRTLSLVYNIGAAVFGGLTPFILSTLVETTGQRIAPSYYLMFINVIGLIIFITMFKSTSNKSLRGSYPNVETQADYEDVVKNPKDALWWESEEIPKK
ncbi:MFS transporter [Staphylococcus xylosus]|uniref:Putative proline/betaine transporter n=2 Tax=Staphylococcus TaxID=1279 RepID=A0AAQ0RWP6_STAXY|nr:MFS transporter [Staphylococcus xylosus]MCM3519559.1 MFS transporter [Staphylococcus xylosus]MCQ3817601.1 MFS transporter [Staphylococcus xylosus]MCQ3820395.1 MFS transporter [Staphylococcus xylosus]PTI00199.1 MFS transporter [Staphylococcus xylosus]RIM65443.1 MFS transporter [Staphylococcus xylosus]